VPLNYKLSGNENLKCVAYDDDKNKWTDEDIITDE